MHMQTTEAIIIKCNIFYRESGNMYMLNLFYEKL